VDRLEGHWPAELAAVDARGAAGAEHGVQVGATAAWLRARLRMGPTAAAAAGCVRTARALCCGPLTATAQALAGGELSAAHAQVLAAGTHDLPAHTTAEAEPVLLAAAGGWTHPGCGGPGPSAAGRRPRPHRPGRAAPPAARAVAGCDLGGDGGGGGAVGPRGRPDLGGGVGAPGPPSADDPALVASAAPMP
jgi:hypothetical protein